MCLILQHPHAPVTLSAEPYPCTHASAAAARAACQHERLSVLVKWLQEAPQQPGTETAIQQLAKLIAAEDK